MTDGVIHRPPREHYCFAINSNGITLTEPYWKLGLGTVIQCPDCGTCWVASEPDNRGRMQYTGVVWKRETPRQRRKRERRARRSS